MHSTIDMTTRRPGEKYWWDDIPDPVKIEIQPTTEEAKEMGQGKKKRAGCGLIFFGALVRIYCFAIGCLMIAYGAWILYQISVSLIPLSIIGKVAAGAFLVLSGLLTVIAETRNRRTMANCVNTYIFLSNHWARGMFYLIVGGLTFSINVKIDYIGQFGQSRVLAAFMVFGGILSLAYAPFRYRYLRARDMAAQPRAIAFGEEIAYQMNITHTSQIKTPVGPPQPLDTQVEMVEQSKKEMYEDESNGATPMAELSLSKKMEKGKDKEFEDVSLSNSTHVPQGVPVM